MNPLMDSLRSLVPLSLVFPLEALTLSSFRVLLLVSDVVLQGDTLAIVAQGNGVNPLRDSLKDNEVNFVLVTLRLTLEGVPDQPRNVFIHWKGPSASGMLKVKYNQKINDALAILSPNHGQLEATGKAHFDEQHITERWSPSSGSHILD